MDGYTMDIKYTRREPGRVALQRRPWCGYPSQICVPSGLYPFLFPLHRFYTTVHSAIRTYIYMHTDRNPRCSGVCRCHQIPANATSQDWPFSGLDRPLLSTRSLSPCVIPYPACLDQGLNFLFPKRQNLFDCTCLL